MSQPRRFSATARAEQMIALARLALAAGTVLAFAVDPPEPARFAGLVRALTIGYAAWAVVTLYISRSRVLRRGWLLGTHAVDLGLCLVLMTLTTGTESPFFVYLVFALVSATLRWETSGALWTGGAALVVFLGAALIEWLRGGHVETNIWIVRATYLMVLALMLAYAGRYGAHVRGITQRLGAWHPGEGRAASSIVAEGVRYVAEVLAAPRVVFIWEEPEEPDLRMTWWSDGRLTTMRDDQSVLPGLVLGAFESTDFLCRDASKSDAMVIFTSAEGIQTGAGPAVNARFVERFGIGTLIAAQCRPGRLFVLDKAQLTVDDLWLAQIVAQQVSSSLEQASLAQRLEEARLVDARGRVARDLHDGVLQSLTAITLRLQGLARTLDAESRQRIERLQTTIGDEARRLRGFIQELSSTAPPAVTQALADRLEVLRQQVERDWELHVEIDARDLARIPPHLAHEVYFLVREALINVARHAGASTARAALAVDGAQLHITVSDDGHGFPFEGRCDGKELAARNRGPKMLYERVTSLGGGLIVESGARGATIDIDVPLPEGREFPI
jgi:signal transduction histidine kinase